MYLEDGSKESHVASELACIMPGCDVPLILTQGTRRIHYRHHDGTEHSRSSPFLCAAAAMIEHWVREHFDDAEVRTEGPKGSDPGAGDVLLVKLTPNGDKMLTLQRRSPNRRLAHRGQVCVSPR